MLDAGIDIDDPLVVDRSLSAKSGDIVIALIDNDFTVKRLMIDHHFSPQRYG
jgi:DNA polymerase V